MTDTHEPVVRSGTADDADAVLALAAVMALTFDVEAGAFGHAFGAVVADPDAHLLVVEDAGEVGGYLLGFVHPSFFANGPVAWVEELAVRGDLRRRGLGARPVAEFEERVRDVGCPLVALATTRADAFYEALGYDRHAAYFRKLL